MLNVTNHPTTSINNDYFRMAFQDIARAALPHLKLDQAYHTDLLWDAHNMAEMAEGAEAYIIVRDCGTAWYANVRTMAECIAQDKTIMENCNAMLRVTRLSYRFNVEVL